MKLKKGSQAAKNYMASIRAKKKTVKKLSGVKKRTVKKPTVKKASHKDTKSHNVNVSVVSGLDPYVKQINNGLIHLQKEIDLINKEIKITKDSFFKKSLLNRKKYLASEITIGKQLLKKFK